MMMMMMMMTLMKLVNSATKFRHGMDKFYQPNSGLGSSRSLHEAIYTYKVYIYICANPPVCGGMGILKGVVNFTFKGNIQHVSTEFLGNQKIPNPVKLYIQRDYSTCFNRVSRES